MQERSEVAPDSAQVALIEAQIRTENQLRGGASWFWWVAGLSVINTVIVLMGGEWNFVIGLGITQVIDALAAAFAADVGPAIGGIIRSIALTLDVAVIGLFVLFGYFARKGHAWSFIVGMIVFTLDGLIFALVGDWLSVGFHLFGLYCMYGGLKALYQLRAARQQTSVSTAPAEGTAGAAD